MTSGSVARALVVAVAGVVVVSGCGREPRRTKCGEGTFKHGTRCLPYDPDDETAPVTTADPPAGAPPADGIVRLTTDEPATIYYTTDGSAPTTASPSEPDEVVIAGVENGTQIRFFAVDRAGNEESPRSATYALVGPTVRDVTVSFAGDDATISWTNPAGADDFAGVIVARVTGLLEGPANGTTYGAGEDIAPGVTVIYAGSGTTTTDADRTPGVHRYVVWGHTSDPLYGAARGGHASLAVPAQTATVTVNVAAATVTVTTPPSVHGLAGTAAYDGGSSTLTVDLTLTNNAARVLPNAKLSVLSTSVGSFANADGSIAATPFRYFGPEAIAPGAAETRSLTFTGVGATDTVVLSLAVLEAPYVVQGDNAFAGDNMLYLWDYTSGAAIGGVAALPSMEGPGSGAKARAGFFSPDGRFLYVGARSQPRVSIVDMTTLAEVGGVDLAADGSIGEMVADEGGTEAYIALNDGAHAYPVGAAARMYALRLDLASLQELGRVELPGGAVQFRASGIDVSPDGTRVAIATRTRESRVSYVHLLDTATWSLVDTDPGTGGVQSISTGSEDVGESLNAATVAFGSAGNVVYVGAGGISDAVLGIVDLSTYEVTKRPVLRRPARADFVKNRVWIAGGGNDGGLSYLDPLSQVENPLAGVTASVFRVVDAPDGILLYRGSNSPLLVNPDSGATVRTFGAASLDARYTHFLALSP